LKIDVEGHELEILKGGEATLRNFKPIILIEIEQRHHTYDIIQIFDYIKSFGYKTTFFDVNTEKFLSTSNFQFELNQDYRNIKTVNYINNFWCFPI
jgi:hypothetical protein